MKKITIDISSSELKKLLEDYYKGVYNNDSVAILINARRQVVGIYEDEELVTKFSVRRNIEVPKFKIGKCTAICEEEITNAEIKKILNEILEENNYEVDYVNFHTKSKLIGYGFAEEEEIYFDGISVAVKEKQKLKVKQKNL